MSDLNKIGLYLILTNPVIGYEKLAEISVNENIPIIQLRMKDVADREFYETALKLKQITSQTNTRLIINDRLDIALAVKADGVHVGQDDLPVSEIRALIKNNFIVGLSTHSRKQVMKANKESVDYIGIGPVFKTPTKKIPDPQLGLDKMQQMIKESVHPYFCIGGINENNLEKVIKNGADNFCVVRAVNNSHQPEIEINNLMKIWKNEVLI